VHRLSSVFESVYTTGKWANGSGSGSAPENTASYRAFLQDFIADNDIRTVVDLGCGDWQSSKLLDCSQVHYIGYDVVADLVARNRVLYSAPHIQFECMSDEAEVPSADLLIIKDVLQHLPNSEINCIASLSRRYTYVLVTNTVSAELYRADGNCIYLQEVNSDIVAGGMRPIDVLRDPFRWPGREVHRYMSYRRAYGVWDAKSTALVQFDG
jgi:SAM-dependent methyltransferase